MSHAKEIKYLLKYSEKYDSLLKNINNKLNEESVIFDIGSTIGIFTHNICKKIKYNSIHIFEPVKDYYEFSKKILCDYKNISFNNVGCGDKNEKKTIYKSKDDGIGWNTYILHDPKQPGGILPIETMNKEHTEVITIDEYCIKENILQIDFIIIDVEGYEYKVIKGMLNTLNKLKKLPLLYIKFCWGNCHPYWDEAEEVYNKLFNMGYKNVNFKNITEFILLEPNNAIANNARV